MVFLLWIKCSSTATGGLASKNNFDQLSHLFQYLQQDPEELFLAGL